NRRLGPCIAATEWRAGKGCPAAHDDHGAARAKRLQKRLAHPVERNPHIGVPVERKGVPCLLVERPKQRTGAGYERKDVRLMSINELAWNRWVGRIRGCSLQRRTQRRQFSKRPLVPSDRQHGGPGCAKSLSDASAEPTAGAYDYGTSALEVVFS